MDRISRIGEMERILNSAESAVSALDEALKSYSSVYAEIRRLQDYYTGPIRRDDLSADEAGELPNNIPRGVLSEDAIDSLLISERNVLRQMKTLLEKPEMH